eukprot:6938768-Alexandrium_andersonii.AAC.1
MSAACSSSISDGCHCVRCASATVAASARSSCCCSPMRLGPFGPNSQALTRRALHTRAHATCAYADRLCCRSSM